MASKCSIAKIDGGDQSLEADDFEIITGDTSPSPSSFAGLSIVDAAERNPTGSITADVHESRAADGETISSTSTAKSPSIATMENERPREQKEEEEDFSLLIQKEHQLLREELISQQTLITTLGSQHKLKCTQLSDNVDATMKRLELSEATLKDKDVEIAKLKQDIADLTNTTDEQMAKVLHQEEIIECQHQIMNGNSGPETYVNIQPPVQYDVVSAKELKQKQDELQQALERNEALERAMGEYLDKMHGLEFANTELQGLVDVLTDQNAEDRRYVTEMKERYDKIVTELTGDLEALRSGGAAPQRTYVPPHSAGDARGPPFICKYCMMRVTDEALFWQHVVVCPNRRFESVSARLQQMQ